MKKCFIMILMLLPIYTASASDWKEVESIPETELSTLEIKEEKEYLWYRLRKEGGFYQVAPSDDFVKTDISKFSEWSNWTSDVVSGDRIETRTVYHYQDMKKIKYIRFSDISSEHMMFDSIAFYESTSYIPFQRYEVGQDIVFELDIPCDFDALEVDMELKNLVDMQNNYTMEWLYELDLPSCRKVEVRGFFEEHQHESFSYRKMMPNELLYEDEEISLERVESNPHRLVWETEERRVQNQLNYYEREIKEYHSDYSSTPIDDYLYPDFSTEKVRLFVKEIQKDSSFIGDTCKECVNQTCPVLDTSNVKELETCPMIKEDGSLNELKSELDELRITMMSWNNEENNQQEKESSKPLQKQSLGVSIYFLVFLLGFLFGRIMPMKKKV